jgi:hypothetical protein
MIKLRMRSVGHVASMVGKLQTVLVEKSEGKRPRGRPGHRWEDIKLDLKEIEWEGAYCIHPTQDRNQWQVLVNTVMSLCVA